MGGCGEEGGVSPERPDRRVRFVSEMGIGDEGATGVPTDLAGGPQERARESAWSVPGVWATEGVRQGAPATDHADPRLTIGTRRPGGRPVRGATQLKQRVTPSDTRMSGSRTGRRHGRPRSFLLWREPRDGGGV